MTVRVAEKTLAMIDDCIKADQGARFRQLLEPIIPKMEDAFRGGSSPYRKHLGVSLIGKDCARELWYSFRWAKQPKFEARILRLFNRGHLEEARFLALLQMIGCNVWYETEDGGQFRVSHFNEHMGSALDGVANNIPDLNPGDLAYTEFKTSAATGFNKIKKNGLMVEKMQHYVQMQVCMFKYNLPYGLYMVVNKNDDSLYAEIIELDIPLAESYIERGEGIIFSDEPPLRIGQSKAFFKCKFCDYADICHKYDKPDINCRTCIHSTAEREGGWSCQLNYDLNSNPDSMFYGCANHIYNPNLLHGVQFIAGHAEENYIDIKILDAEPIKHGPNHVSSVALCLGNKGQK